MTTPFGRRSKATFSRLEKIFENLSNDIEADLADAFEGSDVAPVKDMSPLPEGFTEEKIVEETTRPDGSRTVTTTIRRRRVTASPPPTK